MKSLPPEEQWMQGMLLRDEWANAATHAIGLFLSCIGLFFLMKTPLLEEDFFKLIIFTVYGASLVLLYFTSTFYHATKRPTLKQLLRKMDHCAIYLLIAGSYTPFSLLVVRETFGWTIFSIVWAIAFLGIFLKIRYGHRYDTFSLALYLIMGWLAVIAAEPFMDHFHSSGLFWLLAGGAFYTTGVIFYVLDKRRFYHAIWHIFVLGGSACHYVSIFLYI